MPKFLEKKLKKEYGKDSNIPYAIMNSLGAMKGNKETEKGKSMQKKHSQKMKNPSYAQVEKSVQKSKGY